jgi:fumarylpyruvate hydrolase
MAKGFDHSAPCGPLTRIEETGPLTQGAIRLLVDGELRQHGNIADMIWSVAEVIAELSRYNTLAPGDLIYTGTPAGVGKVHPGNRLDAQIDGLADLAITIAER